MATQWDKYKKIDNVRQDYMDGRQMAFCGIPKLRRDAFTMILA
jgi:hypothetical protein